MAGDTAARKSGNREQEIASISRALKNIAKELNVPVIALSQLSRAVETRGGDKRPQLSDLRESGSIEQDADQVLFLYRPEYYGITEDEMGQPLEGTGDVIIAKNRHGSLEDVRLRFIGKYTKFCDLEFGDFNQMNNPMSLTKLPDSGKDFDDMDAPNTITLGSKINNQGDAPSGGDDEVPF
jgi:replicative DNA helicase